MAVAEFELWLGTYFGPNDTGGDNSRPRSIATPDVRSTDSFPDLSVLDRDLIESVRRGDSSRYAAWYTEEFEPAWRFARRLVHDESVARDIAQDAFLAIWRDRETWTVHGSVRAHLFQTIRYRALTALRRGRIGSRVLRALTPTHFDSGAPLSGSVAPALDVAVGEEELVEGMRRAVEALPERQRTAMTLRWNDGLANVEIATILEIGEAAVSRLLSRATHTLRTEWEKLAQ